LDREVDKSLRTAYERFGLGDGYQRDAVFNIAFSGDQLAECSLRGGRFRPLAKCLLQFSGCDGMILSLAACTRECRPAAGVCRPAARLSSAASRYSCAFLRKFRAWFMCSAEAIMQLRC
jgi:hypothetical protein